MTMVSLETDPFKEVHSPFKLRCYFLKTITGWQRQQAPIAPLPSERTEQFGPGDAMIMADSESPEKRILQLPKKSPSRFQQSSLRAVPIQVLRFYLMAPCGGGAKTLTAN